MRIPRFTSLIATFLASLVFLLGHEGTAQAPKATAPATPAAPSAEEQAEITRDLIRIRQKEEETPWLRINVAGHTSTVQSLAFSNDSKRLYSGGLDKIVQVWNLQAFGRDLKRVFPRERTLRWQVARGPRGSIFELAVSPADGSIAVAGYGAMGGLGEILILDPVSGELRDVLLGATGKQADGTDVEISIHKDTVVSLAFSADGKSLVSSDTDGLAVLWRKGAEQWQPTVIRENDRTAYGAGWAREIEQRPKVRPITIVGDRWAVFSVLDVAKSRPSQGNQQARLVWQIKTLELNTMAPGLLPGEYANEITALAGSRDGKLLASADNSNPSRAILWDMTRATPTASPMAPGATVVSLAFNPSGDTLALGTIGTPAQLQIWKTRPLAGAWAKATKTTVESVAFSPNGELLAYSGGGEDEVFVQAVDKDDQPTVMRGDIRPVWKAAFAKVNQGADGKPLYRVGLGFTRASGDFNNYGNVQESFDLTNLSLGGGATAPTDFVPTNQFQGNWRVEPQANGTIQLFNGNAKQGFIPFDSVMGGFPKSYCFIPDAKGQPYAIAVGTNRQHSIFIYKLVGAGECPILRHCRGHNDQVNSLGISPDKKYLISGAMDGMAMVWSLADFQLANDTSARWGVKLAVEGNALKVVDAHEAGPLYRRGVRPGDVITQIRYPTDGAGTAETRPAEIIKQLQELPWGSQVVFYYSRNGAKLDPFQLVAAWQPMLSMFVSRDREWAVWAPEGYYDASANGHTKFGWQINRGIGKLPDFYRADQFQKTLERADVVERLLTAGSVPEAFRQANMAPPAEPERVLIERVALTPIISIVSPAPGSVLAADTTKVRAKVKVPGAGKVASAKVFANGVVSAKEKLISSVDVEGGKELTYEWDVDLPADQRNLIQVMVGTDAPTAAFSNVLVERDVKVPVRDKPKLFVLSVGINGYRDKEITPLSYSVADAESVADLLKKNSTGIYDVSKATMLVNEQVTRDKFKTSFKDISDALKAQVKPNDVLVLFLAGHGFVDDNKKYYYASYDLSVDDYAQGKFEGCIAWEDFQQLADIPCRKLAFLDTCHSGAIQALKERGLKAAIREFQEDVIFTITATKGDQKAAENPTWGHGAFTKCLLEGLEGKADSSGDGIVTLPEIVTYVKAAVPALTNEGQHPTAAPDELLPFVSLGLTKVPKKPSTLKTAGAQ